MMKPTYPKYFSLSVSITPVSREIVEQIDLSGIKRKDVPLVRDLEIFVNYFTKNQVKVTIKNRWIPFLVWWKIFGLLP